jgi:hypothetical protein
LLQLEAVQGFCDPNPNQIDFNFSVLLLWALSK